MCKRLDLDWCEFIGLWKGLVVRMLQYIHCNYRTTCRINVNNILKILALVETASSTTSCSATSLVNICFVNIPT